MMVRPVGAVLRSPTDTCVTVKRWINPLLPLSGYMLLAGRVRKPEEEAIILSILWKHFKRTVNPENLFSKKQVTSQFSKCRYSFTTHSSLDIKLHIGLVEDSLIVYLKMTVLYK